MNLQKEKFVGEDALIRYFRKCRCRRMEELHESQRKVDCLDFLIRRTAKAIQ